jgi:uncharacterized OB-fold protein
MPACPDCGRRGREIIEATGRGRLYSWIAIQRAFADAWKDDVPYAVGVVELDLLDCRVVARIEPWGDLRIDTAVRAFYVDHPSWSELRFRPETSGQGEAP